MHLKPTDSLCTMFKRNNLNKSEKKPNKPSWRANISYKNATNSDKPVSQNPEKNSTASKDATQKNTTFKRVNSELSLASGSGASSKKDGALASKTNQRTSKDIPGKPPAGGRPSKVPVRVDAPKPKSTNRGDSFNPRSIISRGFFGGKGRVKHQNDAKNNDISLDKKDDGNKNVDARRDSLEPRSSFRASGFGLKGMLAYDKRFHERALIRAHSDTKIHSITKSRGSMWGRPTPALDRKTLTVENLFRRMMPKDGGRQSVDNRHEAGPKETSLAKTGSDFSFGHREDVMDGVASRDSEASVDEPPAATPNARALENDCTKRGTGDADSCRKAVDSLDEILACFAGKRGKGSTNEDSSGGISTCFVPGKVKDSTSSEGSSSGKPARSRKVKDSAGHDSSDTTKGSPCRRTSLIPLPLNRSYCFTKMTSDISKYSTEDTPRKPNSEKITSGDRLVSTHRGRVDQLKSSATSGSSVNTVETGSTTSDSKNSSKDREDLRIEKLKYLGSSSSASPVMTSVSTSSDSKGSSSAKEGPEAEDLQLQTAKSSASELETSPDLLMITDRAYGDGTQEPIRIRTSPCPEGNGEVVFTSTPNSPNVSPPTKKMSIHLSPIKNVERRLRKNFIECMRKAEQACSMSPNIEHDKAEAAEDPSVHQHQSTASDASANEEEPPTTEKKKEVTESGTAVPNQVEIQKETVRTEVEQKIQQLTEKFLKEITEKQPSLIHATNTKDRDRLENTDYASQNWRPKQYESSGLEKLARFPSYQPGGNERSSEIANDFNVFGDTNKMDLAGHVGAGVSKATSTSEFSDRDTANIYRNWFQNTQESSPRAAFQYRSSRIPVKIHGSRSLTSPPSLKGNLESGSEFVALTSPPSLKRNLVPGSDFNALTSPPSLKRNLVPGSDFNAFESFQGSYFQVPLRPSAEFSGLKCGLFGNLDASPPGLNPPIFKPPCDDPLDRMPDGCETVPVPVESSLTAAEWWTGNAAFETDACTHLDDGPKSETQVDMFPMEGVQVDSSDGSTSGRSKTPESSEGSGGTTPSTGESCSPVAYRVFDRDWSCDRAGGLVVGAAPAFGACYNMDCEERESGDIVKDESSLRAGSDDELEKSCHFGPGQMSYDVEEEECCQRLFLKIFFLVSAVVWFAVFVLVAKNL